MIYSTLGSYFWSFITYTLCSFSYHTVAMYPWPLTLIALPSLSNASEIDAFFCGKWSHIKSSLNSLYIKVYVSPFIYNYMYYHGKKSYSNTWWDMDILYTRCIYMYFGCTVKKYTTISLYCQEINNRFTVLLKKIQPFFYTFKKYTAILLCCQEIYNHFAVLYTTTIYTAFKPINCQWIQVLMLGLSFVM